MPRPVWERRRGGVAVAKAVGNLVSIAKTDGATYGYQFNETSGNLVNFVNPGTNDLTVDTSVVRGAAGPVAGNGFKAYHTSSANGGGSAPFGHIEGLRPTENGAITNGVAYELVIKLVSTSLNEVIIDGPWVGVTEQLEFDIDGAGHAAGLVRGSGGFNLASPSSANNLTKWHHYVWQNAGSQIQIYFDGALDATGSSTLSTNDGTGSSAAIALGGTYGSNTLNIECYLAFFAVYFNTVLTAAQIANHAKASGCPAS